MNTSLLTIDRNTIIPTVKFITEMLKAFPGRKFKAVFQKVTDGSIRTMTFIPKMGWNAMNCIETSDWGRAMVIRKALRDQLTVVEYLTDGRFQVRTLPLRNILSLELI